MNNELIVNQTKNLMLGPEQEIVRNELIRIDITFNVGGLHASLRTQVIYANEMHHVGDKK